MGRKHLTLKQHCRGSHFTWAERLKLQYYWTGSNGYRKIRSHTLLGKIFQKSPKTIKRELQRGMGGKGPQPKSGRHHALAARISELMLVNHYSPYAVLKRLDEEEAWPKGLMICEKTLYNWIEAGDIPYVTIENLPRKGSLKRKKGRGGHRRHSNVEFAARSIEKRPKTVAERKEAGHWEGDTVYSTANGSKECLFTLVERKTRLEVIMKILDRTAGSVTKAFDRLEKQIGSRLF